MDGTILIADDDRTIRTVLTQAFTRAGCKVHATSSLGTLERWVTEGRGDVIVSDVNIPDGNGLELVPRLHDLRPNLPVVIISAQNTINTAIGANEVRAFEYLPKPFDLPKLLKTCAKAMAQNPKQSAPVPPADAGLRDHPLVGRSPVMQRLYREVAQFLNADLPIMIDGETGSGKTLLARTMHDLSDRNNHPFVIAQPEDLSGWEEQRSALARTRKGTLVIEGVHLLTPELQSMLARQLDAYDGPLPRLVSIFESSSNEGGSDRQSEALYYRLSGAKISVPALRERPDDVQLLVDHFLAKSGVAPDAFEFTDEARQLLRSFSWPGNVRQLERFASQLSLFVGGTSQVDAGLLDRLGVGAPVSPAVADQEANKLRSQIAHHLTRYFEHHGSDLPPPGLYQRILKELEIPLLEVALDATRGNQAKCADLLGINRNTLRKKLSDLDIEVTRRRQMM